MEKIDLADLVASAGTGAEKLQIVTCVMATVKTVMEHDREMAHGSPFEIVRSSTSEQTLSLSYVRDEAVDLRVAAFLVTNGVVPNYRYENYDYSKFDAPMSPEIYDRVKACYDSGGCLTDGFEIAPPIEQGDDDEVPPLIDENGAVVEPLPLNYHVLWQVAIENHQDFDAGKCYLCLIKPRYRDEAVSLLGQWPTFGALLQRPLKWFYNRQRLQATVLYTDNVDLPAPALHGLSFFDAIVPIVRANRVLFEPGTLGARYIDFEVNVAGTLPNFNDKLGGTVRNRVVYSPAERKYVPPLPLEVCQYGFEDAMRLWGFDVDDQSQVELVMDALARIFCVTTSAKCDPHLLKFDVDSIEYNLAPLYDSLALYVQKPNLLRLWVRSYNNGEMCIRISKLLLDHRNIELRQVAMLKYGCQEHMTYLMFDCSKVLKHMPTARNVDRVLLRLSPSMRFKKKNANFFPTTIF